MDYSQAMLVFVVLAPGVVFAVLALAVASRLGSGGARCFHNHGCGVFRLDSGAGLGSVEARSDGCAGRDSDLRQLVHGA